MLFRADGRVYLTDRGEIARLDPETGRLAAAIEYGPPRQELLPFHVRDGRLWLAADDSFAVLDADTLEVVSSHGDLPVRAVTGELRSRLGLE